MTLLETAFRAIETKKAPRQIVDQILDAIDRGAYTPGQRLPSEKELAKAFGVSRPSLREALSALQLVGIVRTQKGGGTYVVASTTNTALPLLGGSTEDERPLVLFEARLIYEPAAARAAAEKRIPERLRAIDDALAELEGRLSHDDGSRTDIQFHLAVVRAAENPVITRLADWVSGFYTAPRYRPLGERAWSPAELSRRIIKDAKALREAIVAGEPVKAERLMRAHLSAFRRVALAADLAGRGGGARRPARDDEEKD